MQKLQPNQVLKIVKATFEKAAIKHKTKPWRISSTQFWEIAQGVSEWDVRKSGGLTNIQKALYHKEIAKDKVFEPQKNPDLKKFKFTVPKIESFRRHHVDLEEIFKSCGLKRDEIFRVVVQPDTHVPHHDMKAVGAFCEFLNWYKPHGIVNLGDFLEMGSVAHWPQVNECSPRRIVPEIKEGREVLEMINDAAGRQCKHKWMLEGNHEFWLRMYLNQKIPEVYDDLEELDVRVDLPTLLGLEKLGYEHVPVNEILAIGDANYTHGYYTSTHHAAKHLSVFGCNIYYGHTHDTQSHSAVNVRGLHEAMSLGCLRTLDADFLKGKPQNWNHAFGVFEFRLDGSFTRYVPVIVDGIFSFGGKIFKA